MNSQPQAPNAEQRTPQAAPGSLPLGELKGLWIHRCQYNVHPKYTPDMGVLRHSIAVAASVLRSPSGDGRQVHIGLRLGPEIGKDVCIFQSEIEVIVSVEGFPLDADPDFLDEHAIKLGGPIGVGAIREQLLSLTGRSPFPKVLLPLLPIGQLLKAWEDAKAARANAVPTNGG